MLVDRRLKGLEFAVTHLQNRSYKYLRLSLQPARNITFEKDNKEIDVVTYFKQQHGLDLKYPGLPCVEIQNNVFMPIEVCTVEVSKYWISI